MAGALAQQTALAASLAAAEANLAETNTSLSDTQTELSETQTELNETDAALSDTRARLSTAEAALQDVQDQLVAALAAKLSAENALETRLSEADERQLLLQQARERLAAETERATEAQRQTELLNQQVGALRRQLASLQGLLDEATARDVEAQIQLQSLGNELNSALARVAAEERRRRQLEEAERLRLEAEKQRLEEEKQRLAGENQNLEQYRSEFFGRLREVLGDREGVRIEGDRFVFSSEVLFPPGQAGLSVAGRQQIANVAGILREVSAEIPPEIDWVIRVDGHTDNVPLSGEGEFLDNWELSQARALSVVRYMINFLGIPPERLAANGFGQYQPVNTDDTPEARAQNRRIELKLTEQ